MIALSWLLACGTPDEGASFEIDCVGMAMSRRGVYTDTFTPYPTANPDEVLPRCQLFFSDQLNVDSLELRPFLSADLEGGGLSLADPDWATLWFNRGDEWWVAIDGDVTLTTRQNGILAGGYTVEAAQVVDGALTGERAAISGRFDACVYSSGGADCRYVADYEELPEVSIDAPVVDGDGQAAVCRMLIDEASGGVRVDMVLATWRGDNVADIWTPQCNTAYQDVPTTSFVFHGVEYDGPGTYGPYTARQVGDQWVPGFSWSYPKTFIGLGDYNQACAVYYEPPATVTPTTGSACTYSIETEPGRFSLTCTETEERGSGVLNYGSQGDFAIEMDCDVRFR